MKIFFSHKSHEKPLVREIVGHLPNHVQTWIDEDDLLLGDDVQVALQSAIDSESDFVVLLVGKDTFASAWVQKEVAWAVGKEETLRRTILLPIVLDREAWNEAAPPELKRRKYLECSSHTREAVKALSDQLSAQLFALLSRLQGDPVQRKSLRLALAAVHTVPLRWIRKDDPDIPSNMIMEMQFAVDPEVPKNHPWMGVPTLRLTMTNMGADVQVKDAVVEFRCAGDAIRSTLPNVLPNMDALSAASLFVTFLDKGDGARTPFTLKNRHEESVSYRYPMIARPLIGRGIERVYVEDSMGGRDYVDKEQVELANRYLQAFFKVDGIENVFTNFHRATHV